MRRRQLAGLWRTSCARVRGPEWATGRGGGGGQVRPGAPPAVYLAHLVVLSGQLVPRIICGNGELILVLLIIFSVDPLLRRSKVIKGKAQEK